MPSNVPEEIRNFCASKYGRVVEFNPVSGGCINNGGRLLTVEGEFFLKWNAAAKFPGMFTAEENGLKVLSDAQCVRVPKVLAVYEGKAFSCIIMQLISSAPRSANYWKDLASSLACLHRVTRSSYGLDHDNYIGSLPQYNTSISGWVDFFTTCRLQPQLKIAYDTGKFPSSALKKFTLLERHLPDMLPEEKPALTHGDLWSGNLIIDENGRPVLIDPAVAFVHREMEIAFTKLFGGFDPEFYAVYQEIFAMAPGFQERVDIYNLYPLLVHFNLFGGGYYQQILQILAGLKI